MNNPYDQANSQSYYNPYRAGNTHQDYGTGYRLAAQGRHSQNMASLAKQTGGDVHLVTGIVLSAASIAASNKHQVVDPISGDVSSLNQFTWLISDSGGGKSYVLNIFARPILDFLEEERAVIEEKIWHAKKDEEIWKSKTRALKRRYEQAVSRRDMEELAQYKSELDQHLLDKPTIPKPRNRIRSSIVRNDIKTELKGHGEMSLILQEACIENEKLERHLDILNPAWKNEQMSLTGTHEDVHISHPVITLVMLTQTELFSPTINKHSKLVKAGFYGRCLFFTARDYPCLPIETKEGEELVTFIQQRLRELLTTPKKRLLHLSSEATFIWKSIVNNVSQRRRQEGTKEASIPEFSGKYPVHLLRVAALIHLLYKDNEVIDEDDINQAEILMREVQQEHLHYFSDNKREKLEQDAQQVLEWLKGYSGYRRLTVHNVNKSGPACARDRELLQQQLDLLVSRGFITLHQSGKSIFVNLVGKSRIKFF
ncbi:YfjI family protein [Aeromonas hydrophila]|uniref:YfjI family protein n=1 Tax=Aeromonas hydrophila TaxID=644 RepID=UPI002169DBD9|nr:YfjI family protein [Aeromonas hydrophila]MCS3793676.1 hypothetical protein [Aeromonas hydrophila]